MDHLITADLHNATRLKQLAVKFVVENAQVTTKLEISKAASKVFIYDAMFPFIRMGYYDYMKMIYYNQIY